MIRTDMDTNDTPHRPPKYVEGHYKPHFADPDADFVIYWTGYEVQLLTTDADGDAAGVVRFDDGTPAYEGAGHLVGHIYDGEIEIREFWEGRIDLDEVEWRLERV